jgi:hypothetical protein
MGKTQLFLALMFLTGLSPVGLGRTDIPDELEASIGGMGGAIQSILREKPSSTNFSNGVNPSIRSTSRRREKIGRNLIRF